MNENATINKRTSSTTSATKKKSLKTKSSDENKNSKNAVNKSIGGDANHSSTSNGDSNPKSSRNSDNQESSSSKSKRLVFNERNVLCCIEIFYGSSLIRLQFLLFNAD